MAKATKNNTNKQQVNKTSMKIEKIVKKNSSGKKPSLWARFRIFCNGVQGEFTKVHWPDKKSMVKYSVATIIFIVFFALFFYVIDVIFALIQTLLN